MTDQRQLFFQLPSDYNPAAGLWAAMLEDSRRRTLREVESLSPADLEAPLPDGNSLAALLYHLAAIEMDWLYADILGGQDFPPDVIALLPYDVLDDEGRLTAVLGESLEQHLARLSACRRRLLDVLRTLEAADLSTPRVFEDRLVSPEWALHHLLQHEAEHRGQIRK